MFGLVSSVALLCNTSEAISEATGLLSENRPNDADGSAAALNTHLCVEETTRVLHDFIAAATSVQNHRKPPGVEALSPHE